MCGRCCFWKSCPARCPRLSSAALPLFRFPARQVALILGACLFQDKEDLDSAFSHIPDEVVQAVFFRQHEFLLEPVAVHPDRFGRDVEDLGDLLG